MIPKEISSFSLREKKKNEKYEIFRKVILEMVTCTLFYGISLKYIINMYTASQSQNPKTVYIIFLAPMVR